MEIAADVAEFLHRAVSELMTVIDLPRWALTLNLI
jgi:hypothetical protein